MTPPSQIPPLPVFIRLPICDLLFCLVSLFLHVITVGSIIFAAYSLRNADFHWSAFYLLISLTIAASVSISTISLIWYLRNSNDAFRRVDLGLHVLAHCLLLTVVWRHYVFFRKVPQHVVKFLFCELLTLRLAYSIIASIPSCLFLFYLLFRPSRDGLDEIERPLLIGACLCLVDFCFSLASFNRHVDRCRPDSLILSWPSILCQWIWRCGTVGGRLVILAAYAGAFTYLCTVVVGLHWLLVFLGLCLFTKPSTDGLERTTTGEGTQDTQRTRGYTGHWIGRCFVYSCVYTICFYNPSKEGTRWRFVAFYFVMFLENSLLLTIWILLYHPSTNTSPWIRPFVLGMGWGGFAVGILFMLIYYRYLHVTKLRAAFGDEEKRPIETDRIAKSAPPIITRGPFVCKMPSLPITFRTVPVVDSENGHPPTSDHGWDRNGRRCRSVPSKDRHHRPLPNGQSEPIVAKCSRSLPRRVRMRSEFESPSPGATFEFAPSSHSVINQEPQKTIPRSTFIETIF